MRHRPDRLARAFRRVSIVLCAALGVLAPSAAANSTLSYPVNAGPLTITADDPGVTITVSQIIELCNFCDTRLAVQSPQRFTTANPSCTDTFGDSALFECRPLPSRVDVTGSSAADLLSAGGSGGVGCSSPVVRFVGLGGTDDLRGGCAADDLLGGDGRDALTGGDGGDALDGGADADELEGGAGADTLLGGDGRDKLVPGLGADAVISGGASIDTVSYEERVVGVSVSIGATADDGEAGESDNVAADVENIIGGSGNDTLAGDADSNDIEGGPGADAINPGGGSDFVDGGPGDDAINALDGTQDSIVCGDGSDSVTGDAFDVLDGCETVTLTRELMRDVDNDGLAATDGDCQDRDPAIRLGLPDRPGDAIDSDCVGGDAPYPRVLSGWEHAFQRDRRNTYIRYTKLVVIDVPEQATIELSCRGRGCFKGVRRSRHAKGATLVSLTRHLRRSRLRPRSVLEIRITRADTVGKIIRLTTQRGKRDPVATILCLKPGVKAPRPCRGI